MDSVFGKSSTGFTRDDKDKLARKRALNPALSGAAAGAASGALVANVGGDALRRASQKKVFNTGTNDYQWVNRGRVSPRRAKLGRIGAKTSAKALPLTFAAGGLGAVANVNGIQMSHLWNKKDKVYDQAAKVKEASKVSKASDDLQLAAARLGSDYVRLAVEDYRKKNNIRSNALLGQKFLDGLKIGTAATFMLTPVFSTMLSRPGPDEYKVGIKKAAEPQNPIRKSIFNRD